jgi:N-methylhydantoinase B
MNTPIETLEAAYPLRILRYRLRHGTGGAGRRRGGDGIERVVQVLVDTQVSVLAERRASGPPGRLGGAGGAPGRTSVNGEPVAAKWQGPLRAGDVIAIETPGGGGYGSPDQAE